MAGIVAPFAGTSFSLHNVKYLLTNLLGEKYLVSNSSGILWLGAGGIWLSAFMMVFLPVEMRDRQMF